MKAFLKTVAQDMLAKYGTNIIAIREDGNIDVAPGADFALKENNVLVVLGTSDKLSKIRT